MWRISAHCAQLKGQDDVYIQELGDDSHLIAVLDGHGQTRDVVDHVLRRLPILIGNSNEPAAVRDVIALLATETNRYRDGACIALAHLARNGQVRVATLGDSPALWGPRDFDSVHDLHGLAPHGIANNTRERTRVMLANGQTRGKYMVSPCGRRLLAVTRALGDADFIPLIERTPEHATFTLDTGDFLMLCSDGFCDLQLPVSKTQTDWRHAIATAASAEVLVAEHIQVHGLYDDTSVIVAYRY